MAVAGLAAKALAKPVAKKIAKPVLTSVAVSGTTDILKKAGINLPSVGDFLGAVASPLKNLVS